MILSIGMCPVPKVVILQYIYGLFVNSLLKDLLRFLEAFSAIFYLTKVSKKI